MKSMSFVLVLLTLGCALHRLEPLVPREVSLTRVDNPVLAETHREALRSWAGRIEAFAATARAEVERAGERLEVMQILLLQPPEHLLIETLAFGRPVHKLALVGRRFELLELPSGRVRRGELSDLAGDPLPLTGVPTAWLLALLSGRPFVADHEVWRMAEGRDGQGRLLRLHEFILRGKPVQRLVEAVGSSVLQGCELYDGRGKLSLAVRYREHGPDGPAEVLFFDPAAEASYRLHYLTRVRREIPLELFRLQDW